MLNDKTRWPRPRPDQGGSVDPVPQNPPPIFPYGGARGPKVPAQIPPHRPYPGPETDDRDINQAITESVQDVGFFPFSGTLTASGLIDLPVPHFIPEFWVFKFSAANNNAGNTVEIRMEGANPITLLIPAAVYPWVVPSNAQNVRITVGAGTIWYLAQAIRGWLVGPVG